MKKPGRFPGKKRLRKKQARIRKEIAERQGDPPKIDPLAVKERRTKADQLWPTGMLLMLEVAVPLKVEEVRRWPWDVRRDRAAECSQLIAECGDALIYGSASARPKSRKTDLPGMPRDASARTVFNALVDALAIGALQPGGVRFSGMHFQARP